MTPITFKDRFRYAFDNFMSHGTGALLLGLFGLAALLIFGVAGIVSLAGQAPEIDGGRPGFLGIAWMGLLRTLDTGTMGGDSGSAAFLALMLTVTLGGVFTVSMLIGILNNGLEQKLSELRRGRSRVIEKGHTVVLGWSEQIFSIISELVIANANQHRPCVVVLAARDKVEMEEAIASKVGDTGKTRVVCRTGDSTDLADLEITSLDSARSIIVLAADVSDPDPGVVKTLLAITNRPNRKPGPYHVVAEIRSPRNMDAARLVGKNEVELVLVGDLVARIIAQTCRQSGLSVVYNELLDFGGDEIYLREEPLLVGRTFGECLAAYETSTVIGLHPAGRAPQLNPAMATPIGPGDRIIAISEDDDTVVPSGRGGIAIDEGALQPRTAPPSAPERILILGWNWRAPLIIRELDGYVAPGSELVVVASLDETQSAAVACRNIRLRGQQADTTDRSVLDALNIPAFHHVILLAYSELLGVQEADSHTLITLLHLRDIISSLDCPPSVVTEMVDVRNRALAEIASADDFVVSDRLVSLLLTQISENKALNAVFGDLFDADGSEVYLKAATDYISAGREVDGYTVTEAARRRGEVAIGYRVARYARDASRQYGVTINAPKSNRITFAADDQLVVIAES